jgi:hypothetical protein
MYPRLNMSRLAADCGGSVRCGRGWQCRGRQSTGQPGMRQHCTAGTRRGGIGVGMETHCCIHGLNMSVILSRLSRAVCDHQTAVFHITASHSSGVQYLLYSMSFPRPSHPHGVPHLQQELEAVDGCAAGDAGDEAQHIWLAIMVVVHLPHLAMGPSKGVHMGDAHMRRTTLG